MGAHPLRTSREAFFRIAYDPALDPTDYVVGFHTRAGRIAELPHSQFVPDGEIPWHRVAYIRTARRFVWHRDARFDALFHSGNPEAEEPEYRP